jgi:hypothetical protein
LQSGPSTVAGHPRGAEVAPRGIELAALLSRRRRRGVTLRIGRTRRPEGSERAGNERATAEKRSGGKRYSHQISSR